MRELAAALAAETRALPGWNIFSSRAFLLVFGAAALSVWIAAGAGPVAALPILALVVAVGLALADLKKLVLFFLVSRSALDGIRQYDFTLGALSLNASGFMGLCLIGLALLVIWQKQINPWRDRFGRIFCLFLTVSGFGVGVAVWHFGGEGIVAVKEWIRLASLFSLFFLLTTLFTTPADLKNLWRAAFWSLPVPLVVGLIQAVTGTGDTISTEGQNRIYGTVVHPNSLGSFLVLFMVMAWIWRSQSKRKWPLTTLLGILALTLFLTYSMTGLAHLAVSFLVIGLATNRRATVVLLLLGALALGFSANWQARWEQVKEMNVAEEVSSTDITNSFSWRVLHWVVLCNLWKDEPLFGYGLFMTEKVTPWKTIDGQGFAAHNDFVRLLLETGIVGTLVYLFFLLGLGKFLLSLYRRARAPAARRLVFGVGAVYIAILAESFGAGEPLMHTAFLYYFFTFLAIAAVWIRQENQSNSEHFSAV